MDIFKLLKTLNSAQSSWQITLAIVLGMISGFLPLTTPLNLLILFIAFTINIPLGVFFFMSVIFASLGLLLDPIFASLGYDILTNPTLEKLFTTMYNSTPILWSSYNYTILMGSAVISLLLSIPMFFILNSFINRYRDVLEAKFKESKYFSWLNPYSEEKLDKKPGAIRWWASALFLGVVGLIIAILLLVLDPLIKYGLEYSLSKATGKTIYIDDVNSKIFQATLDVSNIAILSKNSSDSDDITIDKVTLKLNISHLLEKKYDFEIISFGNITFQKSVARRDEAHITKTIDKSASTSFDSIKQPKLPSVSELIAKEGLKSVNAANEIQKNITLISDKWIKLSKGDKQEKQIKSIESKIKSLEKRAKNIKNINDINAVLKDAKSIKKEMKSLEKEMKTLNAEYKKDKKLISKYINDIKTLPMQDYNNLKNKYSLDQNGAMNLIGTHFSSSLENYLRMGEKYYGYIKPYLSKDDDEKEDIEQERMKGKWIKYSSLNPYPDFVIRELNANIIKNDYNFDLKIKDISDNQKIYQKPILGTIASKSVDYKLLHIDIEHNELHKDILTTIESKISGFKLKKYKPMNKLTLNDSLIDESSSMTITNYSALKANINAVFTKTALLYSGSNSKTDRTIKVILSDIDSFKIDSSVGGTIQKPIITLNSDIDKKITAGVKKQVGKEILKYKAKLKSEIQKEFTKQLGDIDLGEFNDVEKILNAALKDNKSLEKLLEKNISKKSMQKKLEKEAIKSLSSKLKFF